MHECDHDDAWVSLKRAAGLLGRGRRKKPHLSAVLRLVRSGRLEGRRVGKRWYVSEESIRALPPWRPPAA
jgi:hypothetical protein